MMSYFPSFSQSYILSLPISVYATGCETDEAVGCVVVFYLDKLSLKQLHSHVLYLIMSLPTSKCLTVLSLSRVSHAAHTHTHAEDDRGMKFYLK